MKSAPQNVKPRPTKARVCASSITENINESIPVTRKTMPTIADVSVIELRFGHKVQFHRGLLLSI